MSNFCKGLLLAAMVLTGILPVKTMLAQTPTQTFTRRVAAGIDDVEQAANGSVSTNRSDLKLVDDPAQNGNAPMVDCDPRTSTTIGCFTSVRPTAQTGTIVFPSSTHTFQELAKSGVTRYTGTNQTLPGNHDFTGYIARGGSSRLGYLSINHENDPGGCRYLTCA